MAGIELLKTKVSNGSSQIYKDLYGSDERVRKEQSSRYVEILDKLLSFSQTEDPYFFSSPGRTEIGGNHTDHNLGRVLAGAVNLDNIAVAAINGTDIVRIESAGYPLLEIDLSMLSPLQEEQFTSASLVRGIAARLRKKGFSIGGFNAVIDGRVPKGSGLSSSASFEVLVGVIFSHLFNEGKLYPIQNALIGQFAENEFFGKPSGLMDQMTCSCGGLVTIDFKDPLHPDVRKITFDFLSTGFDLIITNTGGSHDNLTPEYAAVFSEMKAVAGLLEAKVQREVTLDKIIDSIPRLRALTGDRAILRSIHFQGENQRVVDQVNSLERNDFNSFLLLVIESGYSSYMYNQNIFSVSNVNDQGVALGLALSELLLRGKGAWRVHGGGFAGTIQAFVPHDLTERYTETLEHVFGKDACYKLFIRNKGAVKVDF